MTRTIADFPAYAIVEATDIIHDADGYVDMPVLRHGITYAVQFESRSHGLMWHIFRAGTVIDYCREYNEDPVEAVMTAIERKEQLVWLNPVSVMLSSMKTEKKQHIGLEWGQVVVFDGKRYQIHPDQNQNIKLVEV